MNAKRTAWIVSVLLVAGLVVAVAHEAEAGGKSKQADIEKLLKITGAETLGDQFMQQIMKTFQQMKPDIPAQFWIEFRKEVDTRELVQLTIPIYDKYLTHKEIKTIIKFYETPAGRKLIEVQPKLVQESMVAGEAWGRKIGERAVEKLMQQEMQAPPQ